MTTGRTGVVGFAFLALLALALALWGPALLSGTGKSEVPAQQQAERQVVAKGIVESEEEVDLSSDVGGTILDISVPEGEKVRKGQTIVTLDGEKARDRLKASEAALSQAKARLREMEAGYRSEDVEMAKSRSAKAAAYYERARDENSRQERLYEKRATTLVELEKARETLQVAAAELKESQSSLEKLQKGFREEEVEQSKAAVSSANSEVSYRKAVLKDHRIASPTDGIVLKRHRDPHETVDRGVPILTLVNPDRLRVRAEIEETDVGKVKVGQSVEVRSDAYRDKVFSGTVRIVVAGVKRKAQKTFDPMASFDVNTQDIYIALTDYTGLAHGMTVTVRFKK